MRPTINPDGPFKRVNSMSRPTETLDSSATGANHSNQQHSTGGILSVILILVGSAPYVWFLIINGVGVLGGRRGIATENTGYEGPGSGMFVDPVTLLIIALYLLSPFLSVTGLFLGIAELGKADQKKIFPIIGITLSNICLILFVFSLSRFL